MIEDFDKKVSALEILFSCNFMLCKYLPFNGVCIDILDWIMIINMLPYAKRVNLFLLFRQGDINAIIFRILW